MKRGAGHLWKAVGAAAVMTLSACASEPLDANWDDVDDIPIPADTSNALINGTPTRDRSEIGKTIVSGGACTGTLITPSVMVSARHCLEYTTCEDRECVLSWGGGIAVFEDEQGGEHRFQIERWTSFDQFGRVEQGFLNRRIEYLDLSRSDYWLSDDVALIRLTEPVPASVATPSDLTTARPSSGDPLTVWGYGCTQRITRSDGSKRYRDFSEGVSRSDNLCPGDSGGPVTLGRQGDVLYVNSAFATTSDGISRDVFGDVLFFDDLLQAELTAWGEDDGSDPVIPDPDPVEPDPDPQPDPDPVEPDPEPNPTPLDIVSELNVPLALDDAGGFGLVFTITDAGTYSELQIDMELHHSKPEEMLLVLSDPTGNRQIIQSVGTNPSIYRSYIIPNFDGNDVTGDWVLEFHDTAAGNTGEVRNLKLTWVR